MLHVFNCKDRVPISVVVCGNKVDCIERKVKPPHITYHREKGLQYYDFSVRSLYNFQKPLLFLARRILGEPKLVSTSNIGGIRVAKIDQCKTCRSMRGCRMWAMKWSGRDVGNRILKCCG
jgi:hypothetical protein